MAAIIILLPCNRIGLISTNLKNAEHLIDVLCYATTMSKLYCADMCIKIPVMNGVVSSFYPRHQPAYSLNRISENFALDRGLPGYRVLAFE